MRDFAMATIIGMSRATGVHLWVSDPDGRPLPEEERQLPAYCTAIRETASGESACSECYRGSPGRVTEGPAGLVLCQCHAGLSLLLVPLRNIEDPRAGVAVLGRCFTQTPSVEETLALAERLGISAESLLGSIDSVPRISGERMLAVHEQLGSTLQSLTLLASSRAEATSLRMDLAILAQIGVRLGNALPAEQFLEELLQLAVEMLDAFAGTILLVDPSSTELRQVVAKGQVGQMGDPALLQDGARSILASSEPLVRGVEELNAAAGDTAPSSCVFFVPMKSAGETVGVLAVGCRQPGSDRESMLFFTLLHLLAAQGAALVKSYALRDDLQEKEALASRLLGATLNAQEEERERICMEIHDGVAQMLVASLQYIDAAGNLMESDEKQAWELIRKSKGLLRGSIREVREIIGSLRPATLDTLGLVATLRDELARLAMEMNWTTELEAETIEMSKEMELALYRIMHEAMTNARKYSGTRRTALRLSRNGNRVHAEVQDWGKGFVPKTRPTSADGRPTLGLLSMRKRAELLGGDCDIVSAPGQGTIVRIDLPILGRYRTGGTDIDIDS